MSISCGILQCAGLNTDVAAEAESSIVESSCQKMNLNDMVERNVDLFKQLNRSPEPEQSKSASFVLFPFVSLYVQKYSRQKSRASPLAHDRDHGHHRPEEGSTT